MGFDPAKATAAYVDGLGTAALEKAASYTAGNHWLLLWGVVVSAVVSWLVVRSGLLDRMHQRLESRSWIMRAYLVCAAAFFASAIITLPWSIYAEWYRERSYGLSSQPLGDFLTQDAIGIALSTVFGALFFLGVYALIKRTGKRWWLWSGGLVAVTIAAVLLLSPILIEPLFNDYKPVPKGPVHDALLEMAREANIPEDRLFVYDGSRQSNNFTANVSGIAGSARIAISDVALKSASLDEVKAVTGHEVGHYVLGHSWRRAIVVPLLAILLFFLADRLYARVAPWFGSKAEIGDPRGLPVLLFVVSAMGLLSVPVTNALTRISESEADAYSLRTVNLPDALASALVKTAEYRYPRPHPLQEAIFYTHPSVERRVRAAMDWKATHPANPRSSAPSEATVPPAKTAKPE